MPHSQAIREFWQWFASSVESIGVAYEESDSFWLRDHVSPRVNRLGHRLNWEMGPYHAPDYTFVLSPTVRENLALTRAIVQAAPDIPGWHFLSAKPPKELLDLCFTSGQHSVSADNWLYTLTAFNDGEFVDIDLYLDEPIPSRRLFTELAVESLIGEQMRLERVGLITAHDSKTVPDHVTRVHHLRDHLEQVFAP